MVIRYQALKQQVSLTLPRYVSIAKGLRFVEEKRGWIEKQLNEEARPVPFADGQMIPFMGKEYVIRHVGGRGVISLHPPACGGMKGGDDTTMEKPDVVETSPPPGATRHPPPQAGEGIIIVPGEAEFLARRVREWLKRRAREEIVPRAEQKASEIGKRLKKISLRDTSSRWGSCSHDGNLSFSWRLIFAPAEVLDYLVCHEVAHLAHHNHGPAFWAAVRRLCPDYEKAQNWLKQHGRRLYAYG